MLDQFFSCYKAPFTLGKDHRSEEYIYIYNTRSIFIVVIHRYCEKAENCSMKGQYHEHT